MLGMHNIQALSAHQSMITENMTNGPDHSIESKTQFMDLSTELPAMPEHQVDTFCLCLHWTMGEE